MAWIKTRIVACVSVGDAVKVKKGVLHAAIDDETECDKPQGNVSPDDWNGSLSGWVGIVTDITEDEETFITELTLEWDSKTLRRAPAAWRKFIQNHGLNDPDDFGYLVVDNHDINHADVRDTAEDRAAARAEIQAEFDRAVVVGTGK